MADTVQCSVSFFGPDVVLEVEQGEYDYFQIAGLLVESKKADKTKPDADPAQANK